MFKKKKDESFFRLSEFETFLNFFLTNNFFFKNLCLPSKCMVQKSLKAQTYLLGVDNIQCSGAWDAIQNEEILLKTNLCALKF